MSDGGKGSRPRPYSVNMETYSKNWDSIFRKTMDSGAETPEEPGAQRVTKDGILQEYIKGNWTDIENRS